jgi:hypothetical protein
MKNPAMAVSLSYSGRRGFMSTGPSSIRIMTVDDHPLLREGIAVPIKADPDMELIAEASDGRRQSNSLERRWTRFLSGDSIGQLSKPSNWRTPASE